MNMIMVMLVLLQSLLIGFGGALTITGGAFGGGRDGLTFRMLSVVVSQVLMVIGGW